MTTTTTATTTAGRSGHDGQDEHGDDDCGTDECKGDGSDTRGGDGDKTTCKCPDSNHREGHGQSESHSCGKDGDAPRPRRDPRRQLQRADPQLGRPEGATAPAGGVSPGQDHAAATHPAEALIALGARLGPAFLQVMLPNAGPAHRVAVPAIAVRPSVMSTRACDAASGSATALSRTYGKPCAALPVEILRGLDSHRSLAV